MTIQEHSKWVREKTAAVTEYIGEKRKIDSAVAGRGFSNPPGFLYEIQTGLELATKQKLSAVNYSILDEMIKQELKQSGLDYDLAFKNAMIAWESDKQLLLNDWNQELAMVKRGMAYEDETVKMLVIEVSKRGALLIAAKTAIEREAEAIRLEMAELDGSTGDLEVDLANRKVLTAKKRLEIIPYIQQIIAIEKAILGKELELLAREKTIVGKEVLISGKDLEILGKNQELLVKQGEVIDKYITISGFSEDLLIEKGNIVDAETDLLTAEEEAMDLKESLIRPALESLIEVMGRYVAELAVQQALYDEIAVIKTDIATVKEEQAIKMALILEKRKEISETMSDLMVLLSGLSDHKIIELAPKLSELVDIYDLYADTVVEQTGIKTSITNMKALIYGLIPQQVQGELDIIESEGLLADAKSTLRENQLITHIQDIKDRADVMLQQKTDFNAYTAHWDTVQAEELTKRSDAFNTTIDVKETLASDEFDDTVDNRLAIDEASRDADKDNADAHEDFEDAKVEIQTSAKGITASLTHLLSQD